VIFVTVGSMVPFDRLIQMMDGWSRAHPETKVHAQLGKGEYLPQAMSWVRRVSPAEFEGCVENSQLIVSHAGMGTVITAMQIGRPLVLVPRMAAKGEHTTDHQLDTVKWLNGKPGIKIAETGEALAAAIEQLLQPGVDNLDRIESAAPKSFLDRVRGALVE
jgi:UDP-N-acetylglucosamine transferase subunit ALG13